MGAGSAHSEYHFATGGLPRAEGSAHSECYSATEHQGKVWGSAHSGCYFVAGCEGQRGQRAFGELLLHWIPRDW